MANEVWQVGRVKISRVVELGSISSMTRIIPDATPERLLGIPWLRPHFIDEAGNMRGSIHALLVDTGDRRIIVDTCVGNDKPRPNAAYNMLQTRFLADIEAAGYGIDSIDTVLCTHMHLDHVGWNTMLRDGAWVPTFPRARYLFSETEYRHWTSDAIGGPQAQVVSDSVRPIMEAGLADLVAAEHVICPEVRLLPTPGHTPGHVSVWIESHGASALITGDFLHHPCQMAHPEWASPFDSDARQAVATRRAMFERCAGGTTMVIGTHFAEPVAGRLERDGAAWRLAV